MTEPTVCCVLLTRDRPAMAARAVESFRAQTYRAKRLLIYDTGDSSVEDLADLIGISPDEQEITITESKHINHHGKDKTIGYLRNRANHAAGEDSDIIAHMDDDDWSHPNRLAEQVALLQSSGAECVGYTQALFWDTRIPEIGGQFASAHEFEGFYSWPRNEAWLYTSPHAKTALGGTLCYWRSTWERKHFQDLRHGEDTAWQCGLKVAAVSCIREPNAAELEDRYRVELAEANPLYAPCFIAQVHGSNTSSHINPRASEWKRAPEWDAYCAREMQL